MKATWGNDVNCLIRAESRFMMDRAQATSALVTEELKGQIYKTLSRTGATPWTSLMDISNVVTLLHEVETVHLNSWKICAQWVPVVLSEVHKKQLVSASLNFHEWYDKVATEC